jgi:MerR family mercuric resistance operon transcriptional regulator
MVQSQVRADMTISALARAGGVGVETVRYYQRRELMDVPAVAGAIRRYDANDLSRLRFIRRSQAAGFTLEEIRELISLDRREERPKVRALASARVAALDARIAELQKARDRLARLAKECGAGSKGPCPIIEAFED